MKLSPLIHQFFGQYHHHIKGVSHNTIEAYLVLGLIGILMVSDLLYYGARYNLIQLYNNPQSIHYFNNPHYGSEFFWTPVSVAAATLISASPG